MISPEILRRYPYFAGLDADRLVLLARTAQENTAVAGEYFFREGDALDKIYIVVEGEVVIVATLPSKGREVVVSTINVGEIFAWSGLVPPYEATSSAKAVTACRVIAFDCPQLRSRFDEDCSLGYMMMLRLAQVMRDRIRDMRMETIACLAE
jgi:CRP/FNR family transcriptional regulator, cyclic AMP receptor protein